MTVAAESPASPVPIPAPMDAMRYQMNSMFQPPRSGSGLDRMKASAQNIFDTC